MIALITFDESYGCDVDLRFVLANEAENPRERLTSAGGGARNATFGGH